jgi:hypothetical protein
MSDNLSEIERNWNLFTKLCEKTDVNAEAISGLLDELGDRIVMCPSRDRNTWVTCKTGGLVENALNTFRIIRSLDEVMKWNTPIGSLILVSLFYNIGKIGDLDGNDLFLPQDSDWHREKLGQLYKYNPDIERMSTPHQSLFILQSFGVVLSQDEWLAIATSFGPAFDENKFYVGHETQLALLLQQAVRLVQEEEKV